MLTDSCCSEPEGVDELFARDNLDMNDLSAREVHAEVSAALARRTIAHINLLAREHVSSISLLPPRRCTNFVSVRQTENVVRAVEVFEQALER